MSLLFPRDYQYTYKMVGDGDGALLGEERLVPGT